jgi:surface antigen
MTANNKTSTKEKATWLKKLRRAFPYVMASAAILSLAFFGSKDKFEEPDSSIDMRALAQNSYSASADQISELYIMSEVAVSMDAVVAPALITNYDSVTSAASLVASSNSDKIEKPSVVDTSHLAVGVIVYTVQPGETLASIAGKYAASGVTETMIRWSNNFKASRQVKAGEKIYIPSRAGFVHTVRKGETVNTIATRYESTIEEIVAANNLELSSSLSVGMKILVPNGTLPNTERPDYVAPTPRTNYYYYRARYSAGNTYPYGQCTWWAKNKRPDLPGNMGNANMWATNARRAGFPVDRTPRRGDVFQNNTGYWGHVGYVESVNGDGTITISEMNYQGRKWAITRVVKKSEWQYWNFIHKK